MLGWFRRWRQSRAQQELRRRLNSSDATGRAATLGLLIDKPDPELAANLVPLLADAHAPVRGAARIALHALGGAAVPALLAGLNHHRDDAAATSAELLGEFGGQSAVEPLLSTLKFGRRPTQLAAKRALQRLGVVALPALRAAVEEQQPWVRQQITDVVAAIEAGSSAASV